MSQRSLSVPVAAALLALSSLSAGLLSACATQRLEPSCTCSKPEAPQARAAEAQDSSAQDPHEHRSSEHDSHPPASDPPAGSGSKAKQHGPLVIPHGTLKTYTNNKNALVGLATHSLGADDFEVWHSEVAPGGETPPHRHTTEEIFIILRGEGEVTVGDVTVPFLAPATVIAPAGVVHQLRNTGSVPTEQIVVVGVHSHIYTPDGAEMALPWRH